MGRRDRIRTGKNRGRDCNRSGAGRRGGCFGVGGRDSRASIWGRKADLALPTGSVVSSVDEVRAM